MCGFIADPEAQPLAKISETFDFGDVEDMTQERMMRSFQEAYTTLATAINRKPDVYTRDTDGQATETVLANGDININLSTDKVEMITNHTSPTNITWTQLSP